jgi:hypothetical protein
LLSLAVVFFGAPPAFGQYTRDAAAVRKIDEAVNQHYLATDFNKAEGILTGTVKACEDKCSPQTLARAWMYVGIVRGSGRNDVAGAKEAFQTALSLDPEVKLDSALATPETQAAFAEASGNGAAAPTPAQPAEGGKATGGGAGNMTCTPEVTEVETRRAIPVQCTSDEELTNVELRYRSFGSEAWKTAKMDKVGDSFRATIPCDANQIAGTLRLYVRGRDAGGKDVANWGSKGAPIEITTVEESKEEPPAFPDAKPPERCAAKEICPPDFPGCDTDKGKHGDLDWGASCDNSTQCKAGLLCIDGACESAPSCTTDADCQVGTCDGGKCAVAGGDEGASRGPFKKWWFGLHIAQDFAFVSGSDVCLNQNQSADNWACYLSSNQADAPYDSVQFDTPVGGGGTISGGTAAGTLRFLLSVERAITNNITAGARLGYAIRGGPPHGKQVTYNREPGTPGVNEYTTVVKEGSPFLPIHAELRGTYYFGSSPLGRKGFRPYVHVGGGLAQVDARVVVKVKDRYDPSPGLNNNQDGQLNAWKKMGQVFATAGGGVQFALSPRFALQANVNAMLMLGASGFVLEPSLGAAYGAF